MQKIVVIFHRGLDRAETANARNGPRESLMTPGFDLGIFRACLRGEESYVIL